MTATTGGSLSVVPYELFGTGPVREKQSSMREKDGEKENLCVSSVSFSSFGSL